MANALKGMGTILDAIHKVNPNAMVVGFGYDTNLAVSADLSFKRIFPPSAEARRAWRTQSVASTPSSSAFKKLTRIQEAWETLA